MSGKNLLREKILLQKNLKIFEKYAILKISIAKQLSHKLQEWEVNWDEKENIRSTGYRAG